MRTMARKSWWILLGSLFLAACGGGDSLDGNADPDNPVDPVDSVITVELSFWDCPDPNANSIEGCTATDSLSIGSPVVIYVQITNDSETGTVDRQLVSVSSDKGVLSPEDGQVLTNSDGEAFVRLLAGADSGLATVSAEYANETDTAFVEIGSAVVALSVSTTLGPDEELADGATLAVTAEVTSDGEPYEEPVTVTFSSACVNLDQAVIDEEVTSVGGTATSTYRTLGCQAQDTISANVTVGANTATDTVTIQIAEASPAGVEYFGADPDYINLQGSGGTTVSEVTFVVTDETGSPLQGVDVDFELFTSAGGTNIPTEKQSARSDAEGKVRTSVVAGTIPGSARVQATLTTDSGVVFTTVSGLLSVGSGFPTIDSFSLSFSEFNPLSWNTDGVEVDVTIRAADHFGNPVPDGFAVSFVTEGGAIEPRCQTTNGACSVKWVSQNFRPIDGRVNVMAFAQGEESFTDTNGDGLFSGESEFFIDVNGNGIEDAADYVPYLDLPEAFVDANEDGSRGDAEEFIDYNGDLVYQIANGQFNGQLCNGVDCTTTLLDVFRQGTIQMAGRGEPVLYACGFMRNESGQLLSNDPDDAMYPITDDYSKAIRDEMCTFANREVIRYTRDVDGNLQVDPNGTILSDTASAQFGVADLCIFEGFALYENVDGVEPGYMGTPMAFGTTVNYKANDPVELVGGASDPQPNTNQVVYAQGHVVVPERSLDGDPDTETNFGCPSSATFDFGYKSVGTVEVTATYSDGSNYTWVVDVN
ncbi:Ig-like domain-containing protein [Corallincola spongiicola]|uniref:Big-1 domain-containing protein n=1 Tax=Corallincola spongiicola TaxID=2520508 RepID=A0ABY1WUT0_9GAMM|nr:Ig-like domain-containing protein [Corallincola spongiicola]TAA48493.1 hypothetical protein EXY25_04525 [Corallincola spongiicola]